MNKLRQLRDEKNLSLVELGNIFGISFSQLGKYERNESSMNEHLILQACSFFDVTSDYLLGISNKRTNFQGIVFENEEGKQIIIDPGLFIPNKILVVNEKKLLKITDLDNPTKENIFRLKK